MLIRSFSTKPITICLAWCGVIEQVWYAARSRVLYVNLLNHFASYNYNSQVQSLSGP